VRNLWRNVKLKSWAERPNNFMDFLGEQVAVEAKDRAVAEQAKRQG